MLSVAVSVELDAIPDSLAGLLAMLHPNAHMGSRGVVLAAARRSTKRVLRQLRHHLYENNLLLSAIQSAEPDRVASFGRIECIHGELRRLSHGLCRRLRREDAQGAREIARMLLAHFLEHSSQERVVVNRVLCKLDLAATRRFADALLKRMLVDLAGRGDAASERQSVVDLHAHYVGVIRHLQGRTRDSPSVEVNYEDPCRR
jgi:hypothetical protein